MFVSLDVLFYWSCIDHSRSRIRCYTILKVLDPFVHKPTGLIHFFTESMTISSTYRKVSFINLRKSEKRMRWYNELRFQMKPWFIVLLFIMKSWIENLPILRFVFGSSYSNWAKKNKIWIKMLSKRQFLGTLRVFLRCATKRREWGIE